MPDVDINSSSDDDQDQPHENHTSRLEAQDQQIANTTLSDAESVMTTKQHDQQPLSDAAQNTSGEEALEPPLQTFVKPSTSNATKRDWRRENYCLYCELKQAKLRRHCERKHSNEILVAQAIAAKEVDSSRAGQVWQEIINRGNMRHNQDVHAGLKHDLVVKKRPGKGKTVPAANFVPCTGCLSYFQADYLWKHKLNCIKKTGETSSRPLAEARKMIPMQTKPSGRLRSVLESMRNDQVTLTARNDPYIVRVGERTLSQANSSRKEDMSREKMRTLAKVLLLARDKDPSIKTAQDLPKPSNFDILVQCAQDLSGYSEENLRHEKYSAAMRVGHALSDLAEVLRNQHIKDGLEDAKQRVNNFIQLKNSEWKQRVTASAHHQRQENRWKKSRILPLTEDVMNFNKYLKDQNQRLMTNLKGSEYKRLAELTLADVILFNRRRPREVETLTIEDYEADPRDNSHEEVYESLSISEQLAVNRLKVVTVRGKCGRGVPILLNKRMTANMNLLRDHNKARGVNFVFARWSTEARTPYRASSIMGVLATQAKLNHPENLRKHLATLSQVLDLQENELEQLATHMGHDITTHRQYYRLPSETLLLTKVSKILMAADKGVMLANRGKTIEDMVVDDEEEVEMDTASSSSSETCSPEANATSTRRPTPNKGAGARRKLVARTKSAPQSTADRTQWQRNYNRWTAQEDDFLLSQTETKALLAQGKVPGKAWCEAVIEKSEGVLNKASKDVKNKLHNIIQREMTRLKRGEARHLQRMR